MSLPTARPKLGDNVRRRRVCLLGSRSVGKSALAVQYVDAHFVENYFPTIENTFVKHLFYKGQEYEYEIVDTAGQDEYSLLSPRYAVGLHGFVLVYSIASRPSYDVVRAVYDKILHYHAVDSLPCVLVGQKCDLVDKRQVSPQEGQALAKSMGAAWIEASASARTNVSQVFDMLLEEIERHLNPPPPPPPPSKCIIM